MNVSFDRIADRYDDTRSLPGDIMEQVIDALEMLVDSRKPILDVGVGTARFARPLQARGQEIVGIDISTRMLHKARAKGTEDLMLANVCQLPFADNAFGVAMSVHVLHLIADWRRALSEIARVTTERYVSVASYREDSPAEDMRRYYEAKCEELGHAVKHPGLRERELRDLLRADLVSMVAVHEEVIDVRARIEGFEKRTYSSQWPVPEEIHRQAVEALRARYEGTEHLLERESIYLLAWKTARLKEFLKGIGVK